MKNLLLLFLTTFALSCCNKDDNPKPKTELEKLPPATQTGANTAGCLVNGVAFLPKGYFSTKSNEMLMLLYYCKYYYQLYNQI